MESGTLYGRAISALLICSFTVFSRGLSAQSTLSFQGSVTQGEAVSTPLALSFDGAIARGLKNNLGAILSGTQTAGERGQVLNRLQDLLPEVNFNASETATQVDLPAEGIRITGFPVVLGPFGYTDLRAALNWSLLDIGSLRRYLAERHNLKAAQLSAEDARELVILAVGNAYLLVLADEAQVSSTEAQVATAKISLDQAMARHQAGTAPLIDELRARVDYQTLQQQLIAAQNGLEKDKLALARAIGLPLAQQFSLSDKEPYAALEPIDLDQAIGQARANRRDLGAASEHVKAAQDLRKAATAGRYPQVKIAGDYGDIGTTVSHSHGTADMQAALSVPVFDEFALRGEAQIAQSQLETVQAQQSDLDAQVEADVRDALLDIASADKQVEVSRSSVSLSQEALSQAQQRYANGVSDNLAVSQAEQSLAAANSQQVAALYRHNLAKLNLARAMGAAQNYKSYLGGK